MGARLARGRRVGELSRLVVVMGGEGSGYGNYAARGKWVGVWSRRSRVGREGCGSGRAGR